MLGLHHAHTLPPSQCPAPLPPSNPLQPDCPCWVGQKPGGGTRPAQPASPAVVQDLLATVLDERQHMASAAPSPGLQLLRATLASAAAAAAAAHPPGSVTSARTTVPPLVQGSGGAAVAPPPLPVPSAGGSSIGDAPTTVEALMAKLRVTSAANLRDPSGAGQDDEPPPLAMGLAHAHAQMHMPMQTPSQGAGQGAAPPSGGGVSRGGDASLVDAWGLPPGTQASRLAVSCCAVLCRVAV